VCDTQLDPTLFLIERLIGGDFKAELLGITLQRATLVADGDADDFT
jgi:hypothetical protein